MKTILWYQPEKIDAPDIVAADGVILAKTKRSFAFSKLKEASDKCIDKKTPWCGIVEISDGKVFFVKGSFKGVDEHERTLSFMFLSTKCDDYLLALNKELQVVHQELSEETLKCINKKKTVTVEKIIAAIIIVILAIIAFLTL